MADSQAKRIASAYLSALGWAREWRRTLSRRIQPAWNREEVEAKFRQCNQMEEQAEAQFSAEVDRLEHDSSKEAKAVLETIVKILGNRTDLGFFAKRIVERLKRRFFI